LVSPRSAAALDPANVRYRRLTTRKPTERLPPIADHQFGYQALDPRFTANPGAAPEVEAGNILTGTVSISNRIAFHRLQGRQRPPEPPRSQFPSQKQSTASVGLPMASQEVSIERWWTALGKPEPPPMFRPLPLRCHARSGGSRNAVGLRQGQTLAARHEGSQRRSEGFL